MKANYPVWYLLLFLVMIMGTLASMALNDYGMKLMGYGCIGFGLVFLHELVTHLDRRPVRLVELGTLVLLCGLLACRNLFIEIPMGQRISVGLFSILVMVYTFHSFVEIRKLWPANRKAAVGMIGYYGALVSFLLGFISGLVSISPDYGTVAGMTFMALFVFSHLVFKSLYIGGDTATVLQLAVKTKNRSTVALAALLVTGFFYSLMQYHVLPPLYAGDMPVGYTKLVQRTESGLDPDAQMGEPRHRGFRREYLKFVERTK